MPKRRTDRPVEITRRDFIKGVGGAAAVAAIVAPNAHATFGPGERVRIGVVGGGLGCAFPWHRHPRSVVTAVCNISRGPLDRLSRTYNCDTQHTRFRELVADKNVDAVAVFAPAPLHAAMACEALAAGKHVICAAPAAMTLDECEQLRDVARKTGLTYMLAETSAYRPETIDARRWYAEGRFGAIFYSEFEYHHGEYGVFGIDDRIAPIARREVLPTHRPTQCTAALLSITRERFTEVTAYGWGTGCESRRTDSHADPFANEVGLFKTDRGNLSRVAVFRHVAAGGAERGSLYGEKMSFQWPRPDGGPARLDHPAPRGHMHDRPAAPSRAGSREATDHEDGLPEPLRLTAGCDASHAHLTHEFVSALVESRRPLVDVYEAIAYTAPGIVAHQSALKDGETMKIPDFGRAT